MYRKEEKSKLQQEFWTAFGKYLAPVLSAEGEKINWINYKTGVKNIRFFTDADTKAARIGIKITHPDIELQTLFFEEFKKLKSQFQEFIGEEWFWNLHTTDENNHTISCIWIDLNNVNVLNREHWPNIISFLKPRIIALDGFWCNWKYSFEDLAS